MDCSDTSNYYVGVATKFCGENFHGLLRYVQLLCGCGHKILWRKLTDCSDTSNYHVGVATKFCGENFRGLLRYVQLLCGFGHKILWRKLSRIAPIRPIIMWVWPQNFVEKTFTDCSDTSNYYVGVATKFCGENFHGLLRYVQLLCGCGHKILWRKLSRIAPIRPSIMWVWPQNFVEKTFTDCSDTSNYYVGVATKFCGENFHGLLRYVQLLCGCGHKILWRKLSRIAPIRPSIMWV